VASWAPWLNTCAFSSDSEIISSFPLECLDELRVKGKESSTLHVVEG
jgi:hypothetical protein